MKKKLWILLLMMLMTGCTSSEPSGSEEANTIRSMKLDYAEQFSVDYLENGCAEIRIQDGGEYLLVPEGVEIPETSMTVLQMPLNRIYMAASSAMDLIDHLDSLDRIALTSTKDWSLPNMQKALENEEILYAGKYHAPDYELILSEDCDLAVESTMIYHSPETKEQLERSGIPVLVERSSYETHPLGRMEWLKLYGLLLGESERAEAFFAEKKALFEEVLRSVEDEAEKKTAVFFYVSPNGYMNIRKPGDYISRMIELAGGEYLFSAEDLETEENALSTMNIQMEVFYEYARDADIFIYNSTVEGELHSMEELMAKSSILADCKAVQEGNVWCTGQNLFQQTTGVADMIYDFYEIFHEEDQQNLTYLYRLT